MGNYWNNLNLTWLVKLAMMYLASSRWFVGQGAAQKNDGRKNGERFGMRSKQLSPESKH